MIDLANAITTAPASFDIQAMGVLTTFTVKRWYGGLTDKDETRDLLGRHGATDDKAASVKRWLVNREHAAFKDIVTIANSTRKDIHYKYTLPWDDAGARLLPSRNNIAYNEAMTTARASFDAAVEAFLHAYPQLQEDARTTHGTLYKAADYPTVAQLRDKFSFDVIYTPIPTGAAYERLVSDFTADQIVQMQRALVQRQEAQLKEATLDLARRLYEHVVRMAEVLGKDKPVIHTSLTGTLEELCTLIPRMNVTGDPRLDELADKARASLLVSADTLRANEGERERVRNEADAMARAMAPLMKSW